MSTFCVTRTEHRYICCTPETYHGDLKSIDVKRVYFPIAANIVDKLNQTMNPEDSRNHQDGKEKAIGLDSMRKTDRKE